MKSITVRSGYGWNTGQPFVEVEAEGFRTQMSVGDARALAANLLCAAEAAMSDQFVFTFVSDSVGGSVDEAALMVSMFREWRNGRDYVPGHD